MSLWRPTAPCGPGCLPTTDSRTGWLKGVGRTLAACSMVLALAIRPERAGKLARGLLRALGIRWSLVGAPIKPGTLLVGNHVSWLDIVLMFAMPVPMRAVAKAEVASWPVIGRMARAQGTIFVDRSRPKTLPGTVAEVARALQDGSTVQVFPEGTTTCGVHTVAWRPAFLQAAIDADAPIQRFTLLFSSPSAAFIGDDGLIESLRRVLRLRGLNVTILIDDPILPDIDRNGLVKRLSLTHVRGATWSGARGVERSGR